MCQNGQARVGFSCKKKLMSFDEIFHFDEKIARPFSNNRFELISRKKLALFPERSFLNSNYQGSLPKGMITSSSNFKPGLKHFGINTKNGQRGDDWIKSSRFFFIPK